MSRGKLNFSQKTIGRIIRKSRFARIRQAPITTRRTQSPGNLDRSALHISASPWNVPVNSDTAWNRKKSKRGMKNFRTVLSGTSKGVFGHKNGTRERTGYTIRPFELKSTSKISFTLPFVYQMCTTWYHKLVIIYPCLSPIQPWVFNFFPLFLANRTPPFIQ